MQNFKDNKVPELAPAMRMTYVGRILIEIGRINLIAITKNRLSFEIQNQVDLRINAQISVFLKSLCIYRFSDWMPKTATIKKENFLVIKCVHEMQVTRVIREFAAFFGCEVNAEVVSLRKVNIAPAESTTLLEYMDHLIHVLSVIISAFSTRGYEKFPI